MSQRGEPAEWARAIDSQGAIREVVEDYQKFVRWGRDRYPDRLTLKAYQGADVIIDPRFAFGQPVLRRQRCGLKSSFTPLGLVADRSRSPCARRT